MTTLKLGSKGEEVKILLNRLNLIADGIFGPITEEAVKLFLQSKGLTADGIVGNKTWIALGIGSKRKINEIILHCSATPEGKDYTTSDIKKWHLLRGFSDIGYHYVIYRDGSIHTGRDESKVGAHCTGRNSNSIGICYIGGMDALNKKAKDTRTLLLKLTLNNLVNLLLKKYNLTLKDVHCHNEYAAKACPSFNIVDFRRDYI